MGRQAYWLCLLLPVQAQLRFGRGFSTDGKLMQSDTVFRLDKPPLIIAVELTGKQGLAWDTLWLVAKSLEVRKVISPLARKASHPTTYKGSIRLSQPGIYYLFAMPSKNPRLVLARGRLYITNSAYPSVQALKKRSEQLALQKLLTPETEGLESEKHLDLLELPEPSLDSVLVPEALPHSPEEDPLLEEPLGEIEGVPEAIEEELDLDSDWGENLEDL
ncbi:MAG: hypothetical protein NZ958_05590 [Bacteroidia bacterium]|nr:hypothetical protein [Bacteroidia bacterium]MDW8088947.1 hypothetical protein [Bacteroidia bacterium]